MNARGFSAHISSNAIKKKKGMLVSISFLWSLFESQDNDDADDYNNDYYSCDCW